jgi:hypothetical protein
MQAMTGPESQDEPRLVVVPARPQAVGDRSEVVLEMRERPDGGYVLPVFSSVALLIEQLGRSQPWVCLPLASVMPADPSVRVVIDPRIDEAAPRWQAAALEELAAAAGREDEELSR